MKLKRLLEREVLILLDDNSDKWIRDYDCGWVYRIRIDIGRGDLLVSLVHNIHVKEKNYSDNLDKFSIFLSPTIVKPTNSPDFKHLATIPEPRSTPNASFGLPNDIYNTSASLSYSQDIFLDFSMVNFSILSSYVSRCLNSMQSKQNRQSETALCKQLLSICPLLQESCQTSLLPKEFQHLLVGQETGYLKSLLYCPHCSASQGDYRKYVLSVLSSILLERRSLKTQAPFEYPNLQEYLNLSNLNLIKIYVKEDSEKLSSSFNSFVFNILTLNCCLNDGSLDQIAQPSFNASVNIGMSLSCVNLSACDLNGLDSSSGMIAMKSCNSSNIEFICSNCSLEYFAIDCLIFNNSCQQYSGEYNSKFNNREFIIMNLTGLDLKNETKMFVSTTSFIYQPSFFNLSQAFCFISFPSLMQSSSLNSDFSNNLSNFLSNNALLTFSDKNLRTDSDMLSSGNESIFFFNSSGIDNVKFGILIPPHSYVYPVENVQVFKLFDKEDSSDFDLIEISDIYEKDLANEHEIYAGVKNIYPNDLSFSTNSLVLNTLTNDCSLKCGSLDQIGILLSAKDNARYSVSSLSEIIELACLRNFSYLDNEKDLILFFNLFNNRSSSTEERFERILIRDLCSSTSLNRDSGQYNFTASEKIISFVVPVPINPVNNTVASITNSIYNRSGCNFFNFLCIPLFTSLANFSASFSVNFDLDTILLNSINSSSNSSCLITSSLASPDQFTQGNFSIMALNSSEIFNAMLTIYNSPLCLISSNFSNAFTLFSNLDLSTSGQFTSECLSIFFFNSSGIDNVSVGILAPPNVFKQDVVNTQKGVDIYKSFDQGDISDFKLTRISDVYDLDKKRDFIYMFGE